MDFYLDDETRCKWDSMLSGECWSECVVVLSGAASRLRLRAGRARQPARGWPARLPLWLLTPTPLAHPPPVHSPPSNPAETHLLESGDPDSRCQVVRWVRTFPMAIIAQREYVIARRLFREQVGQGFPFCALALGGCVVCGGRGAGLGCNKGMSRLVGLAEAAAAVHVAAMPRHTNP